MTVSNADRRSHELLIFVPKISPWRIFKHPFVASWDIQKYHQPETKKLTIINFDSKVLLSVSIHWFEFLSQIGHNFGSFSYLNLNSRQNLLQQIEKDKTHLLQVKISTQPTLFWALCNPNFVELGSSTSECKYHILMAWTTVTHNHS